jgi:ssDNA-specific exonuclease RecJ
MESFLRGIIYKNRWIYIAQFYSNKTDNQLKNHYHTKNFQKKICKFYSELKSIKINNSLLEIVEEVYHRELNSS